MYVRAQCALVVGKDDMFLVFVMQLIITTFQSGHAQRMEGAFSLIPVLSLSMHIEGREHDPCSVWLGNSLKIWVFFRPRLFSLLPINHCFFADHQEMASDAMKKLRQVYIKEAIRDSQMAVNEGTKTDLLKCSKCGKRNCTYNQVNPATLRHPACTCVHTAYLCMCVSVVSVVQSKSLD